MTQIVTHNTKHTPAAAADMPGAHTAAVLPAGRARRLWRAGRRLEVACHSLLACQWEQARVAEAAEALTAAGVAAAGVVELAAAAAAAAVMLAGVEAHRRHRLEADKTAPPLLRVTQSQAQREMQVIRGAREAEL